ncbi:LCP family protein [Iamia sp.]|uniref:LCP family protein n=1 Tax=Iamia sp. TaxID=2722710 RepID=UPI002CD62B01|nr:LCP family protein [Iamia sp.]HXH58336.1 LCP family protein [Iamia sp.]
MAVLAAAVTAGTLAYSNEQVSNITRRVIPDGILRTGDDPATEPQNYLIVGVDDASRLAEGDNVKIRETSGRLTDTIMVLRVDPTAATADILSFPRDLYVPISGTGAESRINTAFNTGGEVLLIRTIIDNFGIPIDHYVEIDFAGFRELVEVVEGVPVQFPHPVRSYSPVDDDNSVELDIPEAGCWTLGPRQALGFARVRSDFQVQDASGEWHTDMGGDYSRIERQQLFVQLALRQAITKGARNPNTLRRLIEIGALSVTFDDTLEPDALVDLGTAFRSFDPAELVTHDLPVDEAPRGGPAYLYLREDEAEPTLAVFRGTDPAVPSVSPAEVIVQVRNGTATPGQAGDVTRELAAAGFATEVPDTDITPGQPTTIVHDAGNGAEARLVARQLRGPARYRVGPVPAGTGVVLLTGTDWAGVAPTLRPAGEVEGPTTTTATPGSNTAGNDASTSLPAGEDGDRLGDVEDPDDPAFYRATEPPPDVTCRPTP